MEVVSLCLFKIVGLSVMGDFIPCIADWWLIALCDEPLMNLCDERQDSL
jgi:hypothetical protein